jgi:HAMP domain-containing protein
LLPLHWLLTAATLLIAVVALFQARRVSKRLERLTESYWQLRYEQGQLRARMTRLEPAEPASAAPNPEPQAGATAFVPLSSLKRQSNAEGL